ncbi:MAG: LLM class F420-dependent oxidoreductase [Nocardiopsaceae bacterium]|jgi:probable F420-dependent oxidoreductase|nr:LLM class F420-dependent oxidoreductase [Nocardiopsaceae bacterium]
MASTPRWGITLPLQGHSLPEQREIIAELPDLGYTDAWSSELSGIDAFTPLILASQWTDQIRFGTAIAAIYTRGPALLAMTAATMADLAPGRFVMGIGTSTPVVVEQWNSIPFDAPYRRSRDTLRFLKAALTGEKITEQYETFAVNGFRLERPPSVAPDLALAALRPQMIKLAADEAGAAITNWLSPADVPKVRSAAGADCELIARIFVLPTTDTDLARTIGRRLVTGYLTVPAYAAFHDWLGRGELLTPMQEKWAAGDRRGASAAIPDEVIDDLVIHGDLETCRERVDAYRAAGLDTPVIAIVSPPGMDVAEAVRGLAPPC